MSMMDMTGDTGSADGEEWAMPVSPRQRAMYEASEALVEQFGQFDQTSGPDGAHYMADNPFAASGLACASCLFYEGPRGCELVAGDIDPAAICKLWVIPADLITVRASDSLNRLTRMAGLLERKASL